MAKGTNQKLKLLYIAQLFTNKTDEEHGLTTKDIIEYLAELNISVNRKTIYKDIEELNHFGMDIRPYKDGRSTYYNLVSRDFELPELKLLVDSVQSSKFITQKKSLELIKKLEGLVSIYEAKQLNRQVFLADRVKTMNECIYYSVDIIHDAINRDCQIEFQYTKWNIEKKLELCHDGKLYCISPWALVWDDEYYYLLGYDPNSDIIKHYRVDKMKNLSISDKKREGKEIFEKTTIPKYSKSLFSMFGGELETVELLCKNDKIGTIIDRFGKDIPVTITDNEHFTTQVNVSISPHFIGWIIALGSDVKIIGPESVVDQMKEKVSSLVDQYS